MGDYTDIYIFILGGGEEVLCRGKCLDCFRVFRDFMGVYTGVYCNERNGYKLAQSYNIYSSNICESIHRSIHRQSTYVDKSFNIFRISTQMWWLHLTKMHRKAGLKI